MYEPIAPPTEPMIEPTIVEIREAGGGVVSYIPVESARGGADALDDGIVGVLVV